MIEASRAIAEEEEEDGRVVEQRNEHLYIARTVSRAQVEKTPRSNGAIKKTGGSILEQEAFHQSNLRRCRGSIHFPNG